jgi:hypothetical protein
MALGLTDFCFLFFLSLYLRALVSLSSDWFLFFVADLYGFYLNFPFRSSLDYFLYFTFVVVLVFSAFRAVRTFAGLQSLTTLSPSYSCFLVLLCLKPLFLWVFIAAGYFLVLPGPSLCNAFASLIHFFMSPFSCSFAFNYLIFFRVYRSLRIRVLLL